MSITPKKNAVVEKRMWDTGRDPHSKASSMLFKLYMLYIDIVVWYGSPKHTTLDPQWSTILIICVAVETDASLASDVFNSWTMMLWLLMVFPLNPCIFLLPLIAGVCEHSVIMTHVIEDYDSIQRQSLMVNITSHDSVRPSSNCAEQIHHQMPAPGRFLKISEPFQSCYISICRRNEFVCWPFSVQKKDNQPESTCSKTPEG